MTFNSALSLNEEQKVLASRVAVLEKELAFTRTMYRDVSESLPLLTKGGELSALVSDFNIKMQSQLSHAYCLFLVCDSDCLHWTIQGGSSIDESLLNSKGQLISVPQALITFVASPSCPKRRDVNIQGMKSWDLWKAFFEAHSFSDVSMVSLAGEHGSLYVMLAFERQEQSLEASLMELALEGYVNYMEAVFERVKADKKLLEDSHQDPQTGLLRRYSFENSFNLALKDSHRHFQRMALLSIKLLSASVKIDVEELKTLVGVIKSTVRDNDLVAYYDERELVIAIRIQGFEDAEIVASKVLKFLKVSPFDDNHLVQSGVSIGVAFYPEYSTLEDLHNAALFAADSLQGVEGYLLEFYGKLYKSSSEFYSF